jgi:hypothetical protein
MGKKGFKSEKGQPESGWGEPKAARLNLQVTETAKNLLKEKAEALKVSIAEVIERLSRDPGKTEQRTQSPATFLSLDQIERSLVRFSLLQLAKLQETISRFIRERLEGVVSNTEEREPEPEVEAATKDEVDEAGQLAIAFVRKLAAGEQPTPSERARLSEAIDINGSVLAQIKLVKNGEKEPNGT